MLRLTVLALLLSSFGVRAEDDRTSARALNSQGVDQLKAGKLEDAVTTLEQAVALDPKYALAHYNFACALARMRSADKTCLGNAFRSRIVEHLEKSIALDPKRRDRAKVDDDLKPVHDTLAFHRVVLQRKLTSASDVRAILVGVTWYGPSPDMYGPRIGVQFKADGTVLVWERTFDKDGTPGTRERRGEFELDGTKIKVHIPEGAANMMATRSANLSWTGLEIHSVGVFSDDPDECSA